MTQLLAILLDVKPGLADRWPASVVVENRAAVFTTAQMRPRMGRKAAARAAATRQRALEALMDEGTVLPALPGTALRPKDAAVMLQANDVAIQKLGTRLRGLVQFQLQIGYDPAEAQDWLGLGPKGTDTRMRELLDQSADTVLAPIASEMQELPTVPGLAINRTLLIDAARERALDQAVHAIDALWTDGLKIRQIGPAPAVSFASIGLTRVDAAQIAQSFAHLDLHPGASVNEIAMARRHKLVSAPAQAETTRSAAEFATMAQTTDASAFHKLFLWSEGQSAPDADDERIVA